MASSTARDTTRAISAGNRASVRKIVDRLMSGEFTSKNGFSVVAPTSVTSPSSTARQECVLLRLGEAMDLVEKQKGPAAIVVDSLDGRRQDLPHVLDACRGGGELLEPRPSGAGDDSGKGGLACARRAPEDQRDRLAGFDDGTEGRSRSREVLLAYHLVEFGRPHAGSQRGNGVAALGALTGKQVILVRAHVRIVRRHCDEAGSYSAAVGLGPGGLHLGADIDAKIGQLVGVHAPRRAGEGVCSGLGLGKGDHLADVRLVLQDRDEAVDAEGEAGMRRGAVPKGLQEPPEATLGVFLSDAQHREHLTLHLGVVYSHASRAEFEPVEHEVVGA